MICDRTGQKVVALLDGVVYVGKVLRTQIDDDNHTITHTLELDRPVILPGLTRWQYSINVNEHSITNIDPQWL